MDTILFIAGSYFITWLISKLYVTFFGNPQWAINARNSPAMYKNLGEDGGIYFEGDDFDSKGRHVP
jgi:hypothetical protein